MWTGYLIWAVLIAWAVLGARVSRNRKRRPAPEKTTGTGPAWVQDEVYDEVFEEDF